MHCISSRSQRRQVGCSPEHLSFLVPARVPQHDDGVADGDRATHDIHRRPHAVSQIALPPFHTYSVQ